MNIYQFMGDHPWLTCFLAYLLYELLMYPLRLVNRWIRHRNIAVSGWVMRPIVDYLMTAPAFKKRKASRRRITSASRAILGTLSKLLA